MGMECPDEVKWLLPIVVGQSWPEGDETKLRQLADAWRTAAGAIGPVTDLGNQGAQSALNGWTGQSADAFKQEWAKYTDGDQAYLKSLSDACAALANSCDQTALDIEYTKYMIIISLIVLAVQIAIMIANAIETFGGSTAGIPIAEVATRATVQGIFKELLEKLAEDGFKKIAMQLVKKIAIEVVKNVAINEAMDAGIQGLQFAEGNRHSWDLGKTGQAVAGGVAAGVVGGVSGVIGEHLPKGAASSLTGGSLAGQVGLHAARGAAEGVATTVGQAALTGNLGNLSAESLLSGASAGAVGGGIGPKHSRGFELPESEGAPHLTEEGGSHSDGPVSEPSTSAPEVPSEHDTPAEPAASESVPAESPHPESAPAEPAPAESAPAPADSGSSAAPAHTEPVPEGSTVQSSAAVDTAPQHAEAAPMTDTGSSGSPVSSTPSHDSGFTSSSNDSGVQSSSGGFAPADRAPAEAPAASATPASAPTSSATSSAPTSSASSAPASSGAAASSASPRVSATSAAPSDRASYGSASPSAPSERASYGSASGSQSPSGSYGSASTGDRPSYGGSATPPAEPPRGYGPSSGTPRATESTSDFNSGGGPSGGSPGMIGEPQQRGNTPNRPESTPQAPAAQAPMGGFAPMGGGDRGYSGGGATDRPGSPTTDRPGSQPGSRQPGRTYGTPQDGRPGTQRPAQDGRPRAQQGAPRPGQDPRFGPQQDPRFTPQQGQHPGMPQDGRFTPQQDPRFGPQQSQHPGMPPQDPRFGPQQGQHPGLPQDGRFAPRQDPRFGPQGQHPAQDPRFGSPQGQHPGPAQDPRFQQNQRPGGQPDAGFGRPQDPRVAWQQDPNFAQQQDPRFDPQQGQHPGLPQDGRFAPQPDPRFGPQQDPRFGPQGPNLPQDGRFAPQQDRGPVGYPQDQQAPPAGYRQPGPAEPRGYAPSPDQPRAFDPASRSVDPNARPAAEPRPGTPMDRGYPTEQPVQRPEPAVPEATAPETATPETVTPQTTAPETTGTETATPETAAPDAVSPGATPEATAPAEPREAPAVNPEPGQPRETPVSESAQPRTESSAPPRETTAPEPRQPEAEPAQRELAQREPAQPTEPTRESEPAQQHIPEQPAQQPESAQHHEQQHEQQQHEPQHEPEQNEPQQHEAQPQSVTSIMDRLSGDAEHPPEHEAGTPSQDYHGDDTHQATPADLRSVRDGLGGGFDDAYRNAMDRRAASPDLAHLSDDAALSLHAYTRTEIAYTANEAFRVGPDDPHFAEANHQVSAIEAGLNELPKLEGADLVRGINFIGNADKVKLTADEYKPGQVAVEPALVSASITRDGLEGSKFGSDVVIHIKSQTFRDVSGISDKPGEREGLGKVGTQLYVHSNEEVHLPDGRVQRVIHAEEIVPGDPRYLDPESARSAMDARRQRFADAKAAEDALPKTKSSIWEALTGSSDPKPESTPADHVPAETTPSVEQPGRSKISDILGGNRYGEDPAQQHQAAEHQETPQHTESQHTESQHPGPAEHQADHQAEQQAEHQPDFSAMAQSSPLHSEPAIDASTGPRELQDKYVAAKHSELPNTNPHFTDADAYQKGYRTNCTRCVVSYAKRLLGIDDHPDPVLPKDLPTRGALDYVRQNLGGTWEGHGSYDSVITRMRQEPVGSHAVIGVLSPDGHGGFTGHVAMVAHTEDGIAFIDPQDGRLLKLPHPAAKIDLLPFGSLAKPEELPAAGHETPAQQHEQPSAIGPDGLPKPALTHELPTKPEEAVQPQHVPAQAHEPQPGHGAGQHVYGTSDQHPDVQHFLDQPQVQEALRHSEESGQTIKVGDDELPVADVIRERLPRHPELVGLMNDNGYLEHSLLARPKTIASLLVHEDALPMLHDAVHTVHEHGPEAVLADHLGDPQPTPLTPEQHEISGHVEDSLTGQAPGAQFQPGFDESRTQDPPYVEEYLHRQYEHAAVAQTELNSVVDSVAGQTDGIPGYRPGPKDWARAMDKVNGYQGDASKLVDLAGAKIQFRTVADAYRALDKIREDPRLTIVKFEDRFENPQDSGYRDLQMSVRMSNGHIAELRLHLLSIDDVAKYEHAVYEVRRDLKAVAKDENREMSPDEQALRNTLLTRTRELFQAALESGLS